MTLPASPRLVVAADWLAVARGRDEARNHAAIACWRRTPHDRSRVHDFVFDAGPSLEVALTRRHTPTQTLRRKMHLHSIRKIHTIHVAERKRRKLGGGKACMMWRRTT